MTVPFAIDLSQAPVRLWRADGDGWRLLAVADAGAPDFAARLAAAAAEAGGGPVAARLPAAQVVFATAPHDGGHQGTAGAAVADAALLADGRLAPADAVVCLRARAQALHVAALDRATLDEAARFTAALGLPLAGCTADPGASGFPGTPWFAPTEATARPVAPRGLPWDATPATASPAPGFAAARDRALAAARRDPARAIAFPEPLDEDPAEAAARAAALARLAREARGGSGWRLRRSGGRAALLTALLAAGLGALALWPSPTPPKEPTAELAMAPPPETPVQVAPGVAAAPGAEAGDPARAPERRPLVARTPGFYTPPPGLKAPPAPTTTDDMVQPGLDAAHRTDALALADPPARSEAPAGPPAPPEARARVTIDARGFVAPTAEGQRAPEGYRVVAGPPPADPGPRPAGDAADAAPAAPPQLTDRTTLAADDPLRRLEPRRRPDGLVERFERARLGGRTRTELAGMAPRPRPASAQDAAPAQPPTAQAAAESPRPAVRTEAARAAFAAARQTAPSPAPAGPALAAGSVHRPAAPTPEAVQTRATQSARIDLSEMNLLGTYGSSAAPRALVRLPDGRVVNLSVGDRLDGGRVAEIGEARLDYVRGGERVTLRMPRG